MQVIKLEMPTKMINNQYVLKCTGYNKYTGCCGNTVRVNEQFIKRPRCAECIKKGNINPNKQYAISLSNNHTFDDNVFCQCKACNKYCTMNPEQLIKGLCFYCRQKSAKQESAKQEPIEIRIEVPERFEDWNMWEEEFSAWDARFIAWKAGQAAKKAVEIKIQEPIEIRIEVPEVPKKLNAYEICNQQELVKLEEQEKIDQFYQQKIHDGYYYITPTLRTKHNDQYFNDCEYKFLGTTQIRYEQLWCECCQPILEQNQSDFEQSQLRIVGYDLTTHKISGFFIQDEESEFMLRHGFHPLTVYVSGGNVANEQLEYQYAVITFEEVSGAENHQTNGGNK